LPDGRADAAAEGEWVLLQGIIDVCAETEEGTWILWDYKTDAVSEADGEERLRLLYTEQLHRYRDALEQAKGQRVTEMWLYSFALGRAVRVF
ncbi:MAG: PD-(D/E)XK nuclease family protein, partial [Lachnospiraceae bacterium]|nr:PD-(D/E)XK nuclease family protein [Lachnospiraceae bacterium]